MAGDRKSGLREGMIGFAEGAGISLVLGPLVRLAAVGTEAANEWPKILGFVLGTGIVLGIARARNALGGALVGAMVGILLGSMISNVLPPWNVFYAALETSRPGSEFVLSGPTLDGKSVDVSRLRGKIVLVDFWATWCTPCLGELPRLEEMYTRFHDDGFEIVGVSLDQDRDQLESFVRRKKLPWPQIYFDEQARPGARSPLANQHNIASIPATFLLDKEGKVAATGLRGQDLENEVDRLIQGGKRQERISVTLYLCMGLGAVGLAYMGAYLQNRWGVSPPSQEGPLVSS